MFPYTEQTPEVLKFPSFLDKDGLFPDLQINTSIPQRLYLLHNLLVHDPGN